MSDLVSHLEEDTPSRFHWTESAAPEVMGDLNRFSGDKKKKKPDECLNEKWIIVKDALFGVRGSILRWINGDVSFAVIIFF